MSEDALTLLDNLKTYRKVSVQVGRVHISQFRKAMSSNDSIKFSLCFGKYICEHKGFQHSDRLIHKIQLGKIQYLTYGMRLPYRQPL
jgi:hypothetical protein